MSFGYGRGPDPAASWNAMGQGTAGTATPQGVLDYMQDVLSGRVAANGVLSQQRAPYDLNKSLRENLPEISPQAIDIAMGIGPGAIRAFHGSPYSFNRFDMSKIGTGEGAQAYGHGLYFAESEPVARSYREGLTAGSKPGDYGWLVNGRRSTELPVDQQQLLQRYLTTRDPKVLNNTPLQSAIIDAAPAGHMYEVGINADPQRLLDWDKPLGQQSADVQTALRSIPGAPTRISSLDYPPGYTPQTTEPTGKNIYSKLIDAISPTGLSRLNAPPRVSQQLNEAGIPGIRYLDQGSRSGGQGTSNYVIFNDKLIDILRKYGIAGPVVGASALAGGNGGGEF